jgi:hypothetical protein
MKMNPNKAFIKQTARRILFAWFVLCRILLNGLIAYIALMVYALGIHYFLGHEALTGIFINVIGWVILFGTFGYLSYRMNHHTITRSVNFILS